MRVLGGRLDGLHILVLFPHDRHGLAQMMSADGRWRVAKDGCS